MKNSVKFFLAVLGTIVLATVSCTKEFTETPEVEPVKNTCKMRLIGSRVNYDVATKADSDTEAQDTTWADGSIIYLRMVSSIGVTPGEAIYDKASDIWTVNYYGPLYEEENSSCVAIYAEDMISYKDQFIEFDEQSVVYADSLGTYSYDGGDLVVTAKLKPMSGRVRFTGKKGTEIKVYGISHYTGYDLENNIFSSTATPVKVTVGEDGYTPYIYGSFSEPSEPTFKVWVDAKEGYTKYCSTKIFQAGDSGVLSIPTSTSHNGWMEGLYFNVNGARFKMIPIEGGTFKMGDPSSTSSYLTVHTVNLTGFCMAETEFTREVYFKMQDGATSSVTNPNLPYHGGSYYYYSDITNTVKTLNSITNAEFVIPSEAQWEFAARGGNKSKGYKYSGSDTITDVAWYSSNASAKHDVKMKEPNELGLYDMSGNIQEWTKDYYAYYPTTEQTNPVIDKTTAGSSYLVIRGGSWYDSANYCTCTYRTNCSESSSYYYAGLRLALDW
jgi:formylglycine-generating enzyme required for sulfatase activity